MRNWRKATYSNPNGACVEVGEGLVNQFRKSKYTLHAPVQNCVEVGKTATVAVRDTKQEHLGNARTVLEFSDGAWGEFLGTLRG